MTAATLQGTQAPLPGADVAVVPANQAPWRDLQSVLGTNYIGDCQCQRFKTGLDCHWSTLSHEERVERLHEQTRAGQPHADSTTGLVAYLGDEPVGWCAVEPRISYERLLRTRITWAGRPDEDRADETVWAVICFVTRIGFRRRGVSYALARAAVDYARERGASAIEGYPIMARPGQQLADEIRVGAVSVFEAAGFRQVGTPSVRRVVMRLDF